ncbi:MAG: hypothetical protein HOB37_09555 [Rhodospirillaceae bacterium]|nr:hypothetical protein [Rhodospirillaceae bacterium]
MDRIKIILERHLADPATGWSLGTFGALAEFHRDSDEAADVTSDNRHASVVTTRGAIGISRHAETRLVPYEGVSTIPTAWTQGVMVCLPLAAGAMNARHGVTELGSDTEALMPIGNDDTLFDLGMGLDMVDVCIRTSDKSLIDGLRAAAGTPFLDLPGEVIGLLKSANPRRVFVSKLGRIEVAQAIPASDEASPMGPHTHILPQLLGRGRHHAANVPVPEGWVPALAFYPPNPVRDVMGEIKSFDRARYEEFQVLINAHAPTEITAAKRAAHQALDADDAPDSAVVPNSRADRTAFRVALRQWGHLNGQTAGLEAWRALCDPTRNDDDDTEEHPGRG